MTKYISWRRAVTPHQLRLDSLELWGSSTVYDVVNLGTARIEIRLQDEHHVVRHAEAFADHRQGVDAVFLVVLVDRNA